jgi:hypothetical protein
VDEAAYLIHALEFDASRNRKTPFEERVTNSDITESQVSNLRQLSKQSVTNEQKEKMQVMRRKIIHKAHLMGWKLPSGKADMERIDNWCLKYSSYHIRLNDHTFEQLPSLVSQMDKAYKTYLKGI